MVEKSRRDRGTRIMVFALGVRSSFLGVGTVALMGACLGACGETTNASGVGGSAGTGVTSTGATGGAATGQGGSGGAALPDLYLAAVVAANGLYVATGELDDSSGTDSIVLTSSDGKTWASTYRGGDEELSSVAASGGRWVAAGWGVTEVGSNFVKSRSLLISEDATTWRSVSSPESEGLNQVLWTGGEFLMTGVRSEDWALWASADGLAWTERSSTGRMPGNLAKGTPGLVGYSLSGAVMFSDDSGVSWSSFSLPTNPYPRTSTYPLGLWPEGDGFGGAASYGWVDEVDRFGYFAMRSSDGRAWDLQPAVGTLVPTSVVRIGDIEVGIAADGGRLLYRNGTADWTEAEGPPYAVALAAGNRFVAVGRGVWSSDDGKTWSKATLPAF